MKKEIWKDILGYEGLYQVSNFGRVKSIKFGKERLLRPQLIKNGYLCINLYKNNKCKRYLIHRLVAEHFLDNPNNLSEVNHKSEDKTDNSVSNLEWCTHEYNSSYGTKIKRTREKLLNGKLSKSVLQYTLNGEFVKEWASVNEAGRNEFNCGTVAACCRGIRKQHKGFIWRYKEDI